MAISIGDAVLKLGVDTKDLDRGMKGIGASIKKHQKAIGIGMVAAGGAILAAGALAIKTYAQMGDEVQKMALRTGFSTEALSELRHAAEISGASLSTLEKGVKRMSGTILDAQDGLETYIRAFQHIGIEVEELNGLNPEQQFLKIAEAIAEVEDPTKRAAIAQDIFGRAGTELLPLFAAGKEGLAALRKEAHELGIVFDQEAANAAAELTDAMTRLGKSTSGIKMIIATQLIPVLLPVIEKITGIVKGFIAWAKEHSGLTKVLVIGGAVLGGLLIVLGGLLLMLPSLAGGIGIVTGAIVGLNMSLGMLVGLLAIATLGLAMIAWGTYELIKIKQEEARVAKEEQRIREEAFLSTWALTEAIGKQKEAIEDETEAIEDKTFALQAMIDVQEKAFAQAKRSLEMIRAPISPEERPYFIAERERLEAMARVAGAAGRGEEASWYAMQAAGIQSRLQRMQHGGIAMRPMVANIAEKQPEAVIPLDRLTRIVGNKIVNIFVELDGRIIGRALGQPLVDEIRLRTGVQY